MIRYSFFVLAVLASAATAIGAVAPNKRDIANLTVVAKNQAFPRLEPMTVQPCITEDCSDPLR